jgi:hypothetical protein
MWPSARAQSTQTRSGGYGKKYIEFPLMYGSLRFMQHSCAHFRNPCGGSWTSPRQAPSQAFRHEGYDTSRTGIGKTSKSRSIKANQGESRWIKANNIVFEIKRLAAPLAACREEFTYGRCHGSKNHEMTIPPDLENRTKSD